MDSSGSPPDAKSNEEKLSDGILLLLKPSIESLDSKVAKIKKSQAELNSSINMVGEGLHGIADNLPNPHDLDPHIKRLANARRKVNIINSILTNCQERLRKLHTNIHKENYNREQALHPGLAKSTRQQSPVPQPNTNKQPQSDLQTPTVSGDANPVAVDQPSSSESASTEPPESESLSEDTKNVTPSSTSKPQSESKPAESPKDKTDTVGDDQ